MTKWVAGGCNVATLLAIAGFSVVPAGRLVAADEQADKDTDKGADKAAVLKDLPGTWSGVRWDSGKGDDPEKGVQLQLTFEGNKVVGNRVPSGAIGEGTFEISKDGTQIDAVGNTGGYRDKSYLGIIKIEGDTLYWCTATGGRTQKRPTEFVADAAEHSYLIIVKRQKP